MRKPVFSLVIFSIIIFTFPFYANDLVRTDFLKAKVNWNSLTIQMPISETIPRVITDTSDPEYGSDGTAYNISEARNKALGIAKEKIYLQAIRVIENIRLDNEFQIIQKVSEDEKFRVTFNKYFLDDKSELKIKFLKEKVFVESVIKFKGKFGILNFLDIEYDVEKFPILEKGNEKISYTGLILDARHLNAETALFPRILTEKGVEIYSNKLVSKNSAIDNGMVAYSVDPNIARKDSRIGENPLYIVALTTVGKSKTDYSIPTAEAIRLLSANETKKHLRKCSVIILLSK